MFFKKAERFETIPYRPSGYSEACRKFVEDPLYKVISVLLIVAAGVRDIVPTPCLYLLIYLNSLGGWGDRGRTREGVSYYDNT